MSYPSMQLPNHRPGKLDTLSWHAIIQTSYPSMQSTNHRQGKLDMLPQHAVETSHRLGKSDMLSQHAQCRQTMPACTVKYALYKRLQKPKTADKLTQQYGCRTRRDLHKKSKQLQYLRRLGKRHEV